MFFCVCFLKNIYLIRRVPEIIISLIITFIIKFLRALLAECWTVQVYKPLNKVNLEPNVSLSMEKVRNEKLDGSDKQITSLIYIPKIILSRGEL